MTLALLLGALAVADVHRTRPHSSPSCDPGNRAVKPVSSPTKARIGTDWRMSRIGGINFCAAPQPRRGRGIDEGEHQRQGEKRYLRHHRAWL
jgi:hypothetical protein